MAETHHTSTPPPGCIPRSSSEVSTLSSGGEMLVRLLAARWLGHGRAIECYLACVAGLCGVLIAIPGGALASVATADLVGRGYGSLLAAPLLIKAALTGGGLVLNIRGSRYSRPMRVAGAFLGSLIWIWLTFKFAIIQVFAPIGFPFCAFAAVFSIRIMGMAAANLPRPGAPGAL